MSIKFMVLCAALAVCCYVQPSQAVDLIEMNDENQAILLLDLSKSLSGVQDAFAGGFAFDSVKDLRKFLSDCTYVNSVMRESSDDAFKGMAKQIKAIMAEPSIATACSVRPKDLNTEGLDDLDTEYSAEEHAYLSNKKTAKLSEIRKRIGARQNFNLVLSHLVNKRINELAEASLMNAAGNVNIFFNVKAKPNGMFDFNTRYKGTCEIDVIRPICKLARRSPHDDTTAISSDLADFISIVQSGDQAKLAEHENASGVSMDELRVNCDAMRDVAGRFLRPIDNINQWIANGMMNEQQFQNHLQVDRDLAFYNELDKLCKLAQ